MLSLLSSHKIIVIDEAQKIPGIGLLIKRMVDARTECKIYVTGSSSLDLAGGVYMKAQQEGPGRIICGLFHLRNWQMLPL